MLYIAENLRAFRKGKDLTQEEAAEMLGVSAQSVSKWERGETFPDIMMLPALANLYQVSVDALIGMDRINDTQARASVFTAGHTHLRKGDCDGAVAVYTEALKTFPNDEGLLSDLAMALALTGDPAKLSQAIAICERVLSGDQGEKVHHTTRAALCFIYLKAGEKEKAIATARNLPHVRESRETVLAQFDKNPDTAEIDSYLRFIAIGESCEQDVIEVDLGLDMVPVFSEFGLRAEIEALRGEDGYRRFPPVRIRDNASLSPRQARVRYYADYLLDKEFADNGDAVGEIVMTLQKIAHC